MPHITTENGVSQQGVILPIQMVNDGKLLMATIHV